MSQMSEHEACTFSRMLSAYFDGELGTEDSRAMEVHLDQCRRCSEELEAIGHVSRSLREASRPDASEGFRRRLGAAVALRRSDALVRLAAGLTAAAAMVLTASLMYIYAGRPVDAAVEEEPFAVMSIEMQQPAFPESSEEEELATYILADLSSEELR